MCTTVSVVLLAFENQKYELKQSLLSVFSQTKVADEIVIVDISSDDENKKFIKPLLKGNEKYICVNPFSLDDSSDRSLFEIGARNSTGDYLAFLKAGDIWDDEKLEIITSALETKQKLDLIIHSCLQRVSVNDEEFHVKIFADKPEFAVFYACFAFSSSVIYRNVFFAFDQFTSDDLVKLNVFVVDEILSKQTSCAQKDLLQTEKLFWNNNNSWAKKNSLLQQLASFCIEVFHKAALSLNSYKEFAKNVDLASADAVAVLFNKKEFTNTVIVETNENDKKNLERKNSLYIFARDWLEFKIAGGNVADKLKELDVSKIAIYGAGKHGAILYNDLKNSDVKVKFWIDASPKTETFYDIPVLNLDSAKMHIEKIDAVVVTPFFGYF